MRILHNKATGNHNLGEIAGEGPYRIANFDETVSTDQIHDMKAETERLIALTHSPKYLKKIRGACFVRAEIAEVKLGPESFVAMMTSATLAIMAANENGFAVTRPPGHHAAKERPEGFCFFNNVAIATNSLLEKGKRVCIIDIDGHHGDGTELIFRNEERVMFCSIHQANTYPYGTGLASYIGDGPSLGKVINIPIPAGSGDDSFQAALELIVNRTKEFNPDHIAVSAGFDALKNDSILDLKCTEDGYRKVGEMITSIGKPVFAVLEGGYHERVKQCVEMFVMGIDKHS